MKLKLILVTLTANLAWFIPANPSHLPEGGTKLDFTKISKQKALDLKLHPEAKAEYTISFYQDYIFTHESGWQTDSVNSSSGACGLGQAWPCSKMPCSLSQAGFDCQMAFFNQYAQDRYGSWANAYNYWLSHHNW